jgi:choice-of-anchor B domain-containing protein
MKKILFFYATVLFLLPNVYSQNRNITLESNVKLPEVANDIWGFQDKNGTEYAVIGSLKSAYIYSLEDPKNPKLRYSTGGASSTWRDIKYYKNHLYVTHDQDTFGITIIDVSKAPDTITHTQWNPVLTVNGVTTKLVRAHNLYIDSLGFAYIAGHNISKRGVMILDLNPNPKIPVYKSETNTFYSHDAFVQNDLLYSSELGNGFAIYDVKDKSKPIELGRARSTRNFTHNAWLSQDSKYLYTTDEVSAGFVESYDVSNPKNIRFLDKYKTNAGNTRVIPHNTHVHGKHAVTSWYTDGIIITDMSDPNNIVNVGSYDTYPQDANLPNSGNLFFGCWGAYPYLPSGLILASDINNGLFVLKPTPYNPTSQAANYFPGAYLNGNVYRVIGKDTTKVNDYSVTVQNTDIAKSINDGSGYKIGLSPEKIYKVMISSPTIGVDSAEVDLAYGNNKTLDFYFISKENSVNVRAASNQALLDKVGVQILDFPKVYEPVFTNALGVSRFLSGATANIDLAIAKWGYIAKTATIFKNNTKLDITLDAGLQDDILFDLGWKVLTTAATGAWVIGKPEPSLSGTVNTAPFEDSPEDIGYTCFVTGNGGGSSGSDDIDGGITTLTSPSFSLLNTKDIDISFYSWFYNGGGNTTPDDTLSFYLTNSKGQRKLLEKERTSRSNWFKKSYKVTNSEIDFTNEMNLEIIAGDYGLGHVVEAGFDNLIIKRNLVTSIKNELISQLLFYPNPAKDRLSLDKIYKGEFRIYDIQGKIVANANLNDDTIDIQNLVGGSYVLKLTTSEKTFIGQFIKN